ncbi:MAG: L-threonylcarbamoyladenylate synthase [Acutalibacteraceae bacterium]|nr:threonylcarbamoyl-AMP synthase [Clostridia bacterium]MEE3451124.1 L-threonylcarbamoyladenylate synthase [Acutalibacteraceae bacterium]
MKTKILLPTKENINIVGRALQNGMLAALPTETVYGLAADALNGNAVKKIFKAKGRPADNPLIVHISELEQIERFSLVRQIPPQALLLAKHFWPGPLTVIMPKGKAIPDEVSAGLDTVAIRFPSHPVVRAVISAADRPLAAPSANISGSPSPTTAEHVFGDLNGIIPYIIDGGSCSVGVESTVITLCTDTPCVLRPGGITPEQLESILGRVDVSDAVLHELKPGQKAESPGMKYKHYAPKADLILIKSSDESYIDYVNKRACDTTGALCYDEDVSLLNVQAVSYGSKYDYASQASKLFDALRQLDNTNLKTVYGRCPDTTGLAMAVYNRLIRSAGFEVIELA